MSFLQPYSYIKHRAFPDKPSAQINKSCTENISSPVVDNSEGL